ncbi:MAG: helix-turn-helix transcriptional regulator [Boseongicola sp.]|nr:helix-turn-helix transcriptional regulator [Boseongicola sp.]
MTGQAHEFLTVHELADLLRIKERKVYDLAASGKVPCSRATGKLLFPEAEIRAWMANRRTGPLDRTERPNVILGSHDPLLEWAVRQSRCGLALLLDGSRDGVSRFVAGEGVAAGLHIHDAGTNTWNEVVVDRECSAQDAVLLSWAARHRGLIARPENAGQCSAVSDLAGRKVAARQRESGADILLRHLLAAAGIPSDDVRFTEPVRSEQDAALAVAEGLAEATFGLESVAKPFGLAFAPLVLERFDILVDRRAYFEEPFQALLAFCRSPALAERADALGGYDISGLGEVRWTA